MGQENSKDTEHKIMIAPTRTGKTFIHDFYRNFVSQDEIDKVLVINGGAGKNMS